MTFEEFIEKATASTDRMLEATETMQKEWVELTEKAMEAGVSEEQILSVITVQMVRLKRREQELSA